MKNVSAHYTPSRQKCWEWKLDCSIFKSFPGYSHLQPGLRITLFFRCRTFVFRSTVSEFQKYVSNCLLNVILLYLRHSNPKMVNKELLIVHLASDTFIPIEINVSIIHSVAYHRELGVLFDFF